MTKTSRQWDYAYSSTLKRRSISSKRRMENTGLKNGIMLIYGNLIIKEVCVAE